MIAHAVARLAIVLVATLVIAWLLWGCSSPPPPLRASPVYVDTAAMVEPYTAAMARLRQATGIEIELTDDPEAPVRAYALECPIARACGYPYWDHFAIYYDDPVPPPELILHEHIHQLGLATNKDHLPPGNIFGSSPVSDGARCLTAADLEVICRVRRCPWRKPECE